MRKQRMILDTIDTRTIEVSTLKGHIRVQLEQSGGPGGDLTLNIIGGDGLRMDGAIPDRDGDGGGASFGLTTIDALRVLAAALVELADQAERAGLLAPPPAHGELTLLGGATR